MNNQERARCWAEFERACRQRSHPFRQPVVMSIDEEGYPSGRVLTLRQADPLACTLRFHIDRRSPKYSHWVRKPVVSAVFYDGPGKWQVRVKGVADIHFDNDIARNAWDLSHPMCKRTYLSQYAPGTEINEEAHVFPLELERRRPSEDESEPGYRNFAVLLVDVLEMDSLHLAGTGHQRFRIAEEPQLVQRLAP